jgi:hypothetical protein
MAKLRVDKIASVGVSTETTGSVFFDGTSDGLRSSPYDELTLGTGAFTVECWFWRQNITDSWGSLVSDNIYSATGGWDLYTQYDDIVFWTSAGETFRISDCFSAQTWTHVAAQRDSSGNFSCYINGVNQSVSASNSIDLTDNRILIGGNNSPAGSFPNYVFNGYISNVRVCRGHTVYTSNFAVPTRELEVHPGPSNDKTIFLACYDGENIFAEKTGKIIAATGDRLSSPTPTATDSPIGITTNNPGLTRDVDNTFGPTFQGGAGYASQNWLTLPKGTTTDRNRTGGRGLFFGGYAPSPAALRNIIDYVTISSQGNAQDFGDLLSINNGEGGNCASSTRALAGGGQSNSVDITYVTISSTSNVVDFGDLITGRRSLAGASSSTRGVFAGGTTPDMKNEIEYVTIATFGNALDFGNLTVARRNLAPAGSPTRGVFAGGNPGSSPNTDDTIDYITFASTGDATDFGNLSGTYREMGGTSSSTRALFGGGGPGSSALNTIEYVTIATTGNTQDFGDLSLARSGTAGLSNKIRGVFGGGSSPTYQNLIDFVTIASTGDAADFGDLTAPRFFYGAASDSHGGIS